MQQLYKDLNNRGYEFSPDIKNRFENVSHLYSEQDFTTILNKDIISSSTTFDATQQIIPISMLESLVRDEDTFQKFLNFEENREFFGKISQKDYAEAVQQLQNLLQKQDVPLDDVIRRRMNVINDLYHPSRLTDFYNNEYIKISFSNKGLDKLIPIVQLQDILENDSTYERFIDFQNNKFEFNKGSQFDYLKAFTDLKRELQVKNPELSSTFISRITDLEQRYLTMLNYNDQILGDFSAYGANQASVRNSLTHTSPRSAEMQEFFDIIQKYYPKMSKKEKIKFMSGINRTGVCSYATVLNDIYVKFSGQEKLFKQVFGFDMYKEINGVKVLNDAPLLLDFYTYTTLGNNNVNVKNIFGRWKNIGGDEVQRSVSRATSKKVDWIEGYLQSKGIPCKIEADVIFSNWIDGKGVGSAMGDLAVTNVRNTIEAALANGKQVELAIFRVNDPNRQFTFYPLDGGNRVDSWNWHEGAGHSICITGLTSDGDLLVSSWGKKYELRFDEIRNSGITLFETNYDFGGLK